ncbi:MAG: ATP-dependent Clp protease proteolytic subunit [Candidatus Peribacteraceae bacterium]|nr:ATP-dependent Clp protease proteolytic subunit [Candidatus Peribacteraceae bacterium]
MNNKDKNTCGIPEGGSTDIEDSGIYLLMEGIDDDSCAKAIKWILEMNLKKTAGLIPKIKELTIIVNSPGGSVSAGFALIDIMRGSNLKVNTVGIGMIASCGLLIFMAGRNRILTPNTSILSHQWSWAAWGKEHELFATVKEFDLTKERILTHYKKYSKLKIKQINEILLPAHDVWLSSEDALKYGLCDEVRSI